MIFSIQVKLNKTCLLSLNFDKVVNSFNHTWAINVASVCWLAWNSITWKNLKLCLEDLLKFIFFTSLNIQSFSSSLKVCQKCGNYDTTFGMNSLKGFAGALGTTSLSLMGKLLEINTDLFFLKTNLMLFFKTTNNISLAWAIWLQGKLLETWIPPPDVLNANQPILTLGDIFGIK